MMTNFFPASERGPKLQPMWVVLDRDGTPLLVTADLEHAVAGLADAWRAEYARATGGGGVTGEYSDVD